MALRARRRRERRRSRGRRAIPPKGRGGGADATTSDGSTSAGRQKRRSRGGGATSPAGDVATADDAAATAWPHDRTTPTTAAACGSCSTGSPTHGGGASNHLGRAKNRTTRRVATHSALLLLDTLCTQKKSTSQAHVRTSTFEAPLPSTATVKMRSEVLVFIQNPLLDRAKKALFVLGMRARHSQRRGDRPKARSQQDKETDAKSMSHTHTTLVSHQRARLLSVAGKRSRLPSLLAACVFSSSQL